MKGVGSGMQSVYSYGIAVCGLVTGLVQIIGDHPEAAAGFWIAAALYTIAAALEKKR